MKHIVCFSGGKDSTALVLWAKENLPEFTTVFCDTKWESPITLAYIEQINQRLLGGALVRLSSEQYLGGMRELVQIKGMVPTNRYRFCTAELKVEPMARFLREIPDDFTVYDGKRKDESEDRSCLSEREFSDGYDCYVEHPLRDWTVEQVFEIHKRHDIQPNPLYLMGLARVGCFPCINITLRELRRATHRLPEIRANIRELERLSGRTFFKPDKIPARFHDKRDEKSGKTCATCEAVFRYLDSVDEDQLPLLPARSCLSVYNLCE